MNFIFISILVALIVKILTNTPTRFKEDTPKGNLNTKRQGCPVCREHVVMAIFGVTVWGLVGDY